MKKEISDQEHFDYALAQCNGDRDLLVKWATSQEKSE